MDKLSWEGLPVKHKCVLLSPKGCTLNHMVVIIAKVYILLVKISHLFIISSRGKCSLLEKGIELELMHLNFSVHTAMMNSLFMTLLTFFCLARIHLLVESRNAPCFGVFFLCPLKQNKLVIQMNF